MCVPAHSLLLCAAAASAHLRTLCGPQAPAQEGTNIALYLRPVHKCLVLCEAASGTKAGVKKDEKTTKDMATVFEDRLGAQLISFTHDFMALTGGGPQVFNKISCTDERVHLCTKLGIQLNNFRYIKAKKQFREGEKESFKLTGKMSNLNDDLAVATQMGPYWNAIFSQSQRGEYTTFRRELRL